MANKAEIIDKYGVVQHMLNIARHNRKEQAENVDPNVDRILAMLRLKDNVAVKDLQTVLGVDEDSLNTSLGAMSKDGLVQVVAGEDGSVESVSITEKGGEDQPKVQELSEVALAGFDDDELETFESYLNRMETAITGEIGADWKEREEERKAKKSEQRKSFDRGGSRGGFGGRDDRGSRGGYRGSRDDRGGSRGGFGGRDDRGSRGGYGDRGGRGGYGSRDDRGSRGGYGDRGSRGGYGNDRGGYRGGRDDRNDRGGYRGNSNRGGYRGGNDRGGSRGGFGGRDDRGSRGGSYGSRGGSYGDRR